MSTVAELELLEPKRGFFVGADGFGITWSPQRWQIWFGRGIVNSRRCQFVPVLYVGIISQAGRMRALMGAMKFLDSDSPEFHPMSTFIYQ